MSIDINIAIGTGDSPDEIWMEFDGSLLITAQQAKDVGPLGWDGRRTLLREKNQRREALAVLALAMSDESHALTPRPCPMEYHVGSIGFPCAGEAGHNGKHRMEWD